MTLTLLFADGTTQAALTDTTVYPSGNTSVRSYAEIHLAEDAMSLAELEVLFKDESKTSKIHFVLEEDGSVRADELYENFIYLTECGKRLCQETNNSTGTATESMHLVVRLEQPTYNEQLIRQIEQAYHIIREGE